MGLLSPNLVTTSVFRASTVGVAPASAMANAEIQMLEAQDRQREKDAARSIISSAIHGIGTAGRSELLDYYNSAGRKRKLDYNDPAGRKRKLDYNDPAGRKTEHHYRDPAGRKRKLMLNYY